MSEPATDAGNPADLGRPRRPRRRRRAAGVVATLAALGLLGYGTADALDVVPGVLTTAPAPPEARPVPEPHARPPAGVPTPGSFDAQAPQPSEVQGLVDALAADPRLTSGVPGAPPEGARPAAPVTSQETAPVDPTVGLAAQQSVPPGTPPSVVVLDAHTGQVLGEREADVPRVPASSLKLYTATAALATLDQAATLDTTTTLAQDGTVSIVAGGDVLLAPDAGTPGAVDGRAGLGDLARETARALTEAGRTQVRVRLDDAAQPPEGLAPGLAPEDVRWIMPAAGLAVHQGTADPGRRAGDPALQAARVFAEALAAQGIAVTGEVERGAADPGAETLATVSSAPIGELVRYAVKESDNTLTEALSRQVGIARGAGVERASATEAVRQVIGELGVDVSGVHLADASGLSPHNRTTARALAQLLDLGLVSAAGDATAEDSSGDGLAGASQAPGAGGAPSGRLGALAALSSALPVGGLDGTLDDRMTGPAAGVARAKTGTLGAVSSLAGQVLTADGRLLSYVVLADGLPRGGVGPARLAIDSFVTELAGCGCR